MGCDEIIVRLGLGDVWKEEIWCLFVGLICCYGEGENSRMDDLLVIRYLGSISLYGVI